MRKRTQKPRLPTRLLPGWSIATIWCSTDARDSPIAPVHSIFSSRLRLPNPVIRSHYGSGFIKQYVRDHLNLRTEPATNNVADYGVKKAVENLPQLREKMALARPVCGDAPDQSARVDGKPRIVHQTCLGTAERVAALVEDRTASGCPARCGSPPESAVSST
jgi:hypothetical protein